MFRTSRITIKPSLDEVRALASQGNMIPIHVELPIDLDTPVSLFLKLGGTEPSFLLESVVGGERVARYSFLGVRIREALVLQNQKLMRHTLTEAGLTVEARASGEEPDLISAMRAEMKRFQFVPHPNLPRFCGGYVGYTGYDVVRQFEQLPNTAADT